MPLYKQETIEFMTPLKAVIIDDSEDIIVELKYLLAEYPEITVSGFASDVAGAVKVIQQQKPDVIFLDIQLQNETGFDLLEKIEVTSKIIFITAFNQYAIKAFELNALDYLLKPIKKERLKKTIDRLLSNINSTLANNPLTKVDYNDVIYLMVNRTMRFVKVALIKTIVADLKYSLITYKDGKRLIVEKSLLEWENVLPEKYFIRIHRSTIVNYDHVTKVAKCKNNTQKVYIDGIAEPVMMSRRYAAKFKRKLSF